MPASSSGLPGLLTRRPLAVALAAALLCAGPSLWLPFLLDDWFILSAMASWLGQPGVHPYFETWRDVLGGPSGFAFFRGEAHNPGLVAEGVVPWWLDPGLRIDFLRPLSSATHLLDVVLFGERPWLHHAHSLLWYLLTVVLVGRLYRRALPGVVGALALLLFAVDDAHAYPAGWIANRNACISLVFGLAGLLAHIRWQQEGWRLGLPLSLLALAAALAGGEGALGVFALLAAWQLLARTGPPAARLAGLAPAGALGLAWALLYKALDHGAAGSGMYIDPTGQTGAYLVASLWRVPMLIGGQLFGQPTELWFLTPLVAAAFVLGGLVGAGLLAWGLRWAWPDLDPAHRAALRWLLPGALLALLPVVATFPLNRLLLVPGIGLGAAVAAVLTVAWQRGRRRLVLLIALPQLLLALPGWWGAAGLARLADLRLDAVMSDPLLADPRPTLALDISDPAIGVYMPLILAHQGRPRPPRWQLLSMSQGPHRLSRPAARTLRLELLGPPLGAGIYERLFRDFDAAPLSVGDTVELEVMRLVVEEVEAGRVTRLRVELAGPVEDVQLLTWGEEGLQRIEPPAVGSSLELPFVRGPLGL